MSARDDRHQDGQPAKSAPTAVPDHSRSGRDGLRRRFLSQLEFASNGPAAAALQPLDELTPLPWEVR
jgi:hypothetical protein